MNRSNSLRSGVREMSRRLQMADRRQKALDTAERAFLVIQGGHMERAMWLFLLLWASEEGGIE